MKDACLTQPDKKRKEEVTFRNQVDQAILHWKDNHETEGKGFRRTWCCPSCSLMTLKAQEATHRDDESENLKHWNEKLRTAAKPYEQAAAAQQVQAGAEGAQATGNAGDVVTE